MLSLSWSARERPPRLPVTAATARLSLLRRHLFLWVLQGWLAMFYIGSAYTKLSQPSEMLALLLGWPAQVDPALVQSVGWLELGLALAVIAPLVSWSWFRTVVCLGAAGLMLNAGVMAVYHAISRDAALAGVNGVLLIMALVVLLGRRTPAGGPAT